MLALHLLLPQVENSIREILTAHGVITSKLESDATQDERDLGWMLTRPEMAKIFGEGMAFDLRGLLVSASASTCETTLHTVSWPSRR